MLALRLRLLGARTHTGPLPAAHPPPPPPPTGYFGGCPVVQVPGFTHPVEDFYLENILQLTGYQEAAQAQLGGLTGGSGGGGGGGRAAALPPEERQRIEDAIEAAFVGGSYESFDALLEVTGAAGADDMSAGAPGVNLVHSSAGLGDGACRGLRGGQEGGRQEGLHLRPAPALTTAAASPLALAHAPQPRARPR